MSTHKTGHYGQWTHTKRINFSFNFSVRLKRRQWKKLQRRSPLLQRCHDACWTCSVHPTAFRPRRSFWPPHKHNTHTLYSAPKACHYCCADFVLPFHVTTCNLLKIPFWLYILTLLFLTQRLFFSNCDFFRAPSRQWFFSIEHLFW